MPERPRSFLQRASCHDVQGAPPCCISCHDEHDQGYSLPIDVYLDDANWRDSPRVDVCCRVNKYLEDHPEQIAVALEARKYRWAWS